MRDNYEYVLGVVEEQFRYFGPFPARWPKLQTREVHVADLGKHLKEEDNATPMNDGERSEQDGQHLHIENDATGLEKSSYCKRFTRR